MEGSRDRLWPRSRLREKEHPGADLVAAPRPKARDRSYGAVMSGDVPEKGLDRQHR
ncbi:hypothetical protein GCM10022252_18460 [Streptosporangium oxazolinicum]|uniref:Uncharacterized protein n=1 Tax=Streptosporangium oxazolinicum TaxID=909287 RepID=A0ABP8AMZ0_9ACTN